MFSLLSLSVEQCRRKVFTWVFARFQVAEDNQVIAEKALDFCPTSSLLHEQMSVGRMAVCS